MSNEPSTVYGKIAQVMLEVGSIAKDATHYNSYKYQSMEQVTTAIRKVMNEVGLIMLSECIGSKDTGAEWLCEYRYTFVDIETGHNHSLLWQQSTPYMMGGKLDDKAMGKNHTYAQKYFLMRTFLVSSKDDPDSDTNNTNDYNDNNDADSDNVTTLQIKNTKGDSKMCIIGGASMFTVSPLKDLGYEVASFGKVGTHTLPDPVSVEWVQSGKYKNVASITRISTGETAKVGKA